jgi:hypothetical protein
VSIRLPELSIIIKRGYSEYTFLLREIQVHWLKLNKPLAHVFILPMMQFGCSFQCLFAKTSDSICEENQRNQTTYFLEYFYRNVSFTTTICTCFSRKLHASARAWRARNN